jgi:coenzyme F420-0:L-glutamate ligase/coenzyme F420-1:gamma-L-glutamate ligase
MTGELRVIPLAGVPEVGAGDDLCQLVLNAVDRSGQQLRQGDAIVLAQKIVSKAEGRRVALADVRPSARARALARTADKDPRLVELILRESTSVLRQRPGALIVAHTSGVVLANAGIDQSNVAADGDGHALLLPENADLSAAGLRAALERACGVELAVLVIDSIGRAWRNGTIGHAIGVSGMPGLLDLRGRADRFGRPLRTSELGLADEVAAAASLMMGQAAEGTPVVIVRGIPYALREGSAVELIRSPATDLFR